MQVIRFQKILNAKDIFYVILEASKSNLPCQLLEWIKDDGMKSGDVYLADYHSIASWRQEFDMVSDRLPKLMAFMYLTI